MTEKEKTMPLLYTMDLPNNLDPFRTALIAIGQSIDQHRKLISFIEQNNQILEGVISQLGDIRFPEGQLLVDEDARLLKLLKGSVKTLVPSETLVQLRMEIDIAMNKDKVM